MQVRRSGAMVQIKVGRDVVEIQTDDADAASALLYNIYRKARSVRVFRNADLDTRPTQAVLSSEATK